MCLNHLRNKMEKRRLLLSPRYCRAVQFPGALAECPAPEYAFVGDPGPWQSWGCGTALSPDPDLSP